MPKKNNNAKTVSVSQKETTWSYQGPIPDPESLRKYKEIEQSLPDRMFNQVEENGRHRRKMEEKTVDAAITLAKRGQLLAFLSGIFTMIAAVILNIFGSIVFSIIAGAFALLILIPTVYSIIRQISDKNGNGEHK